MLPADWGNQRRTPYRHTGKMQDLIRALEVCIAMDGFMHYAFSRHVYTHDTI